MKAVNGVLQNTDVKSFIRKLCRGKYVDFNNNKYFSFNDTLQIFYLQHYNKYFQLHFTNSSSLDHLPNVHNRKCPCFHEKFMKFLHHESTILKIVYTNKF